MSRELNLAAPNTHYQLASFKATFLPNFIIPSDIIMALYEDMKLRIHEVTRSQYSVYLLDALFSRPIFKTTDVVSKFNKDYGIHEKTTPGLLKQLKDAGILMELEQGSGRRAAVLCFPELLNLAEGREVFNKV